MTTEGDLMLEKVANANATLEKAEQMAFDGYPAYALVPGTGISVATEVGKLSVAWPDTPEHEYMLHLVKARGGYEPGKHDKKPMLTNKTVPVRQFTKIIKEGS